MNKTKHLFTVMYYYDKCLAMMIPSLINKFSNKEHIKLNNLWDNEKYSEFTSLIASKATQYNIQYDEICDKDLVDKPVKIRF